MNLSYLQPCPMQKEESQLGSVRSSKSPRGMVWKERERERDLKSSPVILHMCNLVDDEPDCFEVAEKKQDWKDAMVEEYQSILKNDVWDIVPRLKDKSIVSSKCIFKTNHAADGSIEKYKARFVARGFS